MSFKCVPIYSLMFRILTRFHTLDFGASCIHRNSIVWRRVNFARFPYWPEKRKRRISRYSYLMKTLISSEYGLTISGHVTVLRQWLSEKNTDYIIRCDIDLLWKYWPRRNPWNNAMGNCENIKIRLSSSNSWLQCWSATSSVRFRGITSLWRTKTNALLVRGFPNLFLTVVYGVVYRNVGVDNSQSERRY